MSSRQSETPETRRFWQRSWNVETPTGLLLGALMLALVLSNVALLRQNQALKQTLSVRSEPAYLAPGKTLDSLRGLDLQGQDLWVEAAEASDKTVLLVFRPSCPWCQENMGNWTALLDQTDPERFRFVAVSTRDEGVAEYLDQNPRLAELPVIATPDPDDRLRYRLFDTPQTIVLDRQGRVEKIWVGSMTSRLRADVEDYFGVALPEV